MLPTGWHERLVAVRGPGTRGATGWRLEAHDLVLSKLVAGREKDLAFARAAAGHALIDRGSLERRLAETELDGALSGAVAVRIRRAFDAA